MSTKARRQRSNLFITLHFYLLVEDEKVMANCYLRKVTAIQANILTMLRQPHTFQHFASQIPTSSACLKTSSRWLYPGPPKLTIPPRRESNRQHLYLFQAYKAINLVKARLGCESASLLIRAEAYFQIETLLLDGFKS